jgi:hypothetical protein
MLTDIQLAHVARVFPECRKPMADFLERGVDVWVAPQDECEPDVPPYAIRVVERPDFWIDCARSHEEAVAVAGALGLRVVSSQRLVAS